MNKVEALKVDITKVKTVENYAKDYNLSRTTVYKRIKQGDLKTITIDGVNFIKVKYFFCLKNVQIVNTLK